MSTCIVMDRGFSEKTDPTAWLIKSTSSKILISLPIIMDKLEPTYVKQ